MHERRHEITLLAIAVFGDKARAAKWLGEANRALNGQSPRRLLVTKSGAERVKRQLHRIERGTYS